MPERPPVHRTLQGEADNNPKAARESARPVGFPTLLSAAHAALQSAHVHGKVSPAQIGTLDWNTALQTLTPITLVICLYYINFQKVAGSQGVASNDLTPPELHFLTSEDLFAELKNWEDQLKYVDFSVLENPPPDDDEDEGPAINRGNKHGGPTPC